MSHNDSLQLTEKWFKDRLGKVSASNITKVLAGGQGKVRKTYMRKLACEIITETRSDSFQATGDMLKGNEREPEAIALLEFMKNIKVDECGFIKHPTIAGVGASPDGLIGDDGLCEVKNPKRETHLEYLLTGKIPSVYKGQVQCQLWCTDREWAYFVSHHPLMRPLIVKVVVDWDYRKKMEEGVEKFLTELKQMVDQAR